MGSIPTKDILFYRMLQFHKNWLIYKELLTLLAIPKITVDTKKNISRDIKYSTSTANLKFEIKLYLLGLSFNRFIFNFDKALFMLCIITNFLFFLSIRNPRVLFIGESQEFHKDVLSKFSKDSKQFYYGEYILPGILTNIVQAPIYCSEQGVPHFIKHLDCLFSFFCLPNTALLIEAQKLNVPIIGLVEVEVNNFDAITYPIVCENSWDITYFFAKYFSKILNYKNWSPKINAFKEEEWYDFKKLYKNSKFSKSKFKKIKIPILRRKEISGIRKYSSEILQTKKLISIGPKKFTYDSLMMANFVNSFSKNLSFYNINFLFLKYSNLPIFQMNFIQYRHFLLSYIKKKLQRSKICLSNLEKKNNLLQDFNHTFAIRTSDEYANLKLYKAWRKFNAHYVKNYNTKYYIKKKLELETKKKELLQDLEKREKIRARLLAVSPKTDFKDKNLGLKMERKRLQILKKNKKQIQDINDSISDLYKKKKPLLIRKKYVLTRRQQMGNWEFKKWSLFRMTYIPKKRKRIKRFKFFWPLKRLFRINRHSTPKQYLYKKKPRKLLIPRKTGIKKLMFYYYDYALNKSVSKLLTYSNKSKHNVSISAVSNLMNVLESKLCIFITRSRLSSNVLSSKALITGGNILVNGKIIYTPGYLLNTGDIISLKSGSHSHFFNTYLKIKKPPRLKKRRFFNKLRFRTKTTSRLLKKKAKIFTTKYKKLEIFKYFRFYWQNKRKFKHYERQIKKWKALLIRRRFLK